MIKVPLGLMKPILTLIPFLLSLVPLLLLVSWPAPWLSMIGY